MGFIIHHCENKTTIWGDSICSKHPTVANPKQAIVAWLKSCGEGATGGETISRHASQHRTFLARKVW